MMKSVSLAALAATAFLGQARAEAPRTAAPTAQEAAWFRADMTTIFVSPDTNEAIRLRKDGASTYAVELCYLDQRLAAAERGRPAGLLNCAPLSEATSGLSADVVREAFGASLKLELNPRLELLPGVGLAGNIGNVFVDVLAGSVLTGMSYMTYSSANQITGSSIENNGDEARASNRFRRRAGVFVGALAILKTTGTVLFGIYFSASMFERAQLTSEQHELLAGGPSGDSVTALVMRALKPSIVESVQSVRRSRALVGG